MLCKKCNATVRADDGVCRTCGMSVRNRAGKKSFSKIATFSMLGVVLVACIVFVVLYMQGSLNFDIFGSSTQPEPELQNAIPEQHDIGQENAYPDVPEYTTPVIDEAARRATLANIHDVVQAYIVQNSATTAFISYHGFLYNHTDGEFVNIQTFYNQEELDLTHTGEKFIFFLRPLDFLGFDEVTLPLIEQMTVFIGHETITGIGLYSVHGYIEIFRENLNYLLSTYIPTESEIVRPGAQSILYNDAIRLISAHEDAPNNIEMRYFAHNEDFAFTTVSSAGITHILRHYAFVRNRFTGELEIIAHGLEVLRHPVSAINNQAPNFNMELLPPFDLSQNSLLPVSEHVLSQFYTLHGQPNFIATTDLFIYAVMPNGSAFFGEILPSSIHLHPVENWLEAQGILQASPVTPPMYILRQE